MPKTIDPAAAAKLWADQMNSAATSQKYKAGVQAQTVSPGQLAATPEAQQRYLTGVQNAVASGRHATALNAFTLQYWQQQCNQKGAQRLGSGATASLPKMQQHFTKWGPIYQNISSQVQAMPKGGVANAVARVQFVIQSLMQAANKA